MATLSKEEYWDKVYACWMGKNCGGTLGAPLEKGFGEEEPFNIDWYPELREGGIPNDDLEMQLIWLKAIEEQGFDLTARELAQYWLDYIGYNWDEYGLNKTNLRLGLVPPVSGYFNNWFRDCMGSPIRSEIWACLAPGNPTLAVKYAYEDAIVDHAGGEGVWGEVFNAALEAAAFVEQDTQTLLDIGLSYIPAESGIARAVIAAREAHKAGLTWQEARKRVMETTPHYNAQYAPLNLGFQTIGWLYGKDFGDALCTAVNCGYDTDCTGATLGSILGIIGGRASLPHKWTEPLGNTITTNESWGGLKNASSGVNPVPATLEELTDRVCLQGERLLASRESTLSIGNQTDLADITTETLYASADIRQWLIEVNPLQISHQLDSLNVDVIYQQTPTITPDKGATIELRLHNLHPTDLLIDAALQLPAGWTAESCTTEVELPAGGDATLQYTLHAAQPAMISNSNTVWFSVQPRYRPAEPAIPIVFVGSRRWLIWGPDNATGNARELLDRVGAAEQPQDLPINAEGWQAQAATENELPLGSDWTGTTYARLSLWSATEQPVFAGIPGTGPRKIWLNGEPVHQVNEYTHLRPNYGGDQLSYFNGTLKPGWNEVLIKYTRDAQSPPFAAHFTLAKPGLFDGIEDVAWTRLSWESSAQ